VPAVTDIAYEDDGKELTPDELADLDRQRKPAVPAAGEMCCFCFDPTGRAGRRVDSIYAVADTDFPIGSHPESSFAKAGEEVGPMCPRCYGRLSELGWIKKTNLAPAATQPAVPAAGSGEVERLRDWLAAHKELWPFTSGSPVDVTLLVLHQLTAELATLRDELEHLKSIIQP
jgi:hypothetical protein